MGTLYSCGFNYSGQLGLGDNTDRSTPTEVSGGWDSVVAGDDHSLGLKNGVLYAWGDNSYGQLGLGDNTDRSTPTEVSGGWDSVVAGDFHSLGLKGDTLYAWGSNWNGQLGLGDSGSGTHRNTPTEVSSGWSSVVADGHHSLGLKGDTLYAWGDNWFGQLGLGDNDNRNTPTEVSSGWSWLGGAGRFHSFGLKIDAISVFVRNNPTLFPDAQPYKDGALIMIPMRYPIIQMGGNIHWDEINFIATVKIEGKTLKIYVNTNEIEVNGVIQYVDYTIPIIQDRIILQAEDVVKFFPKWRVKIEDGSVYYSTKGGIWVKKTNWIPIPIKDFDNTIDIT